MTANTMLSPLGPLSLHRARALRVPRLLRRTATPPRFNRYLLDVDFETQDGDRFFSVGGGETVAEALAAAREALPPGHWEIVRLNYVHGE